MLRALQDMRQSQRHSLQDKLMIKTRHQFQQDIEEMNSLVDRIIAERRENPDENLSDLLALMLEAKDPVTGKGWMMKISVIKSLLFDRGA